ncbi:hypothetical protein K4L44_17535 [Halosquirtibacter laminarini]|uniref:Uncharacterized protein n=1 Tax=Halosquirtibacter laminarini TaxID=3374600 RepID=A0AC61NR26_9BACT|nr:hypothetical protein K4L44_17535 [Prolixibacteraceae bacterium]
MSKKVTTLLTVLLWVLMITSGVLMVLLMSNLSDPITEQGEKYVTLGLNWSYALLAIVTGTILLFSVRNLFLSGKKALYSVAGIIALVAIFAIAWALGSDVIPTFHGSEKLVADGTLSTSVAHFTDMLLNTTYILMGIAVVAIVVVPSVLRLTRK